MKTHYETLGIPRDATADDIKAAFRAKRGALHPDREGGDAEAMAALNAAHTTLSDPAERAKYDATIPDVTRDARTYIENLFSKTLDIEGDPVDAADTIIYADIERITSMRSMNSKALVRLYNHKARIRFTGTGSNLAAEMIERRIKAAEELTENYVHALAVFDLAGEMLDAYGYEMPPPPPRHPTSGFLTINGQSFAFPGWSTTA